MLLISKFNSKTPKLALSVIFVAALAACGGSDDYVAPIAPLVPKANTAGNVVKAAVAGATVTLDRNSDGVCAADEPKVYSDINGSYTFTALGALAVCADGGVDTATNLPLTGQFRAPAASNLVTALTTLVSASLPVGATSADIATARASVETKLGLPAGSTSQNPVAAIATNPNIEKANASVAMLIENSAKTVAAFSGVNKPLATATAAEKKIYNDAVSAVSQDAVKAFSKALTDSAAPINLTTATSAQIQAFVTTVVTNTVEQVKASAATATSATATALTAAAPTARATISTTSAANVAAFVAPSVSAVIETVSKATATGTVTVAQAIVAATKAVQENTNIVNAVEAVKQQAPTLFAASAATPTVTPTNAIAEIAALAAVVIPPASAVANAPVVVVPAQLQTVLTNAASTANAPAVTAAVATIVAQIVLEVLAPPAPPAPVVVAEIIANLPTLPPVPAPETVPGTVITGAAGG